MATLFCSVQTGYTYPCRNFQGGVKAVYVGVFNEGLTYTISPDNIITSFGGSLMNFYTIAQRQEQASLTYNLIPSIENGTTYWEQTVEVTIEQVDGTLSGWINILTHGQWRLMVLDNMGFYWMVGLKNGAYMTAANGGPKKTFADGNKATLVFSAKFEPAQPINIEANTAIALIR